MAFGSVGAAVALVACALAPGPLAFAAGLMAIELASTFVLYNAAFALLVQINPTTAQRSITHLTLIAGFASTIFWPLTSALHERSILAGSLLRLCRSPPACLFAGPCLARNIVGRCDYREY